MDREEQCCPDGTDAMTRKDELQKYPFASRQVRRFVPWAKVSALVLIATSSGVACVLGVSPAVSTSRNARGLVVLIWFWNVCISAVSCGVVLWAWLVDRYGNRGD